VFVENLKETVNLGIKLSHNLNPQSIVLLQGPIGAGKTSFVQGIAKGLSISDDITSPTFALSHHYNSGKIPLIHLDLYRLENVSSEEKAREWRNKKLCERAKTLLNANQQKHNIYLLTGHTSSDNAETFILNLSRGSNFAGLSNIESKRLIENQIYLIRPILIFSREDTKQFCNEMKIPVWEDPTNSDLKLKRNLVRKKIIPTLEGIYPGCSEG